MLYEAVIDRQTVSEKPETEKSQIALEVNRMKIKFNFASHT